MGHKILLADDSITVQKIVKLTFSDEGVEVIAVGNGELAVQQLHELRPDLVMADVFMPGKDGYEVCEYVKTHPELRHTPVILLVHAFEPFDQERAISVGADQHLVKPFQSIRALVATVKGLIEPTAEPASFSAAASSAAVSAPSPIEAPPIELDLDAASCETAPLALSVSPEPGEGEVLEQGELPRPAAPTASTATELAPLPVELALDQAIISELEDGRVSATEAESPLSLDCGSALNLDFGTETAEDPAERPVADTAPLVQEAQAEGLGEVLELEEVIPPAALSPVDDLEPLAETAILLGETSEADTSLGRGLDLLTPEPALADAIGALPILAEVEMPMGEEAEAHLASSVESGVESGDLNLEATERSFLPGLTFEAQEAKGLSTEERESSITLDLTPEPSTILESPFAPEGVLLNGRSHDYEIGQILEGQVNDAIQVEEAAFVPEPPAAAFSPPAIEAQPMPGDHQTEKQDLGVGVASGHSEGLNAPMITPELIDEIVNRVVERLSQKAIQEVAWEVVPEMAELIIRKQLAEKFTH